MHMLSACIWNNVAKYALQKKIFACIGLRKQKLIDTIVVCVCGKEIEYKPINQTDSTQKKMHHFLFAATENRTAYALYSKN